MEFVALMSRLRACYQNAVADPAMWKASVNQYWETVQHLDAVAIRKAFAAAWKAHPDWMPSLGQLVQLIEANVDRRQLAATSEVPEFTKPPERFSQMMRDLKDKMGMG